jgi:hypothetical protein
MSNRIADHEQIDVALLDPLVYGVVTKSPPAMAMLRRYGGVLLFPGNQDLARQDQ